MFGFLKDKLKKAISKFTTDVKEEVDEKVIKVEESKKEISKEIPEPKKVSEKESVHSKKIEEKKHIEKVIKVDKVEESKHEPKSSHIKLEKKVEEKVKEKVEDKIEKKEKEIIHHKKEEKHVEIKKPEVKSEIKHDIKHEKHTDSKEKEVTHHKKIEEKEVKLKDQDLILSKKEELIHTKETIIKSEPKKHVPTHKHVEPVKHEEKVKEHVKHVVKPEIRHDIKHDIKHEKHEIKETKHIPKKEDIKSKVIEESKKDKTPEKKTGFFKKLFSKKEDKQKEQIVEKEEFIEEDKEKEEEIEIKEEIKLDKKTEIKKTEEPETKKGFFEKLTEVVTKKTLSEEKFDELFFDLEVAMLENNVALEVIEKIKDDMKKSLLSEKVSRMKTEEIIAESLRNSIDDLFDIDKIDIFSLAKKKKPFVICFVGVNGSGKTTNLAKLGNYFKKNGLSVVIAAGDTFRAAAIQQIEEHAKNLDIKLIKHDYGADAAAVAYDAIEHAKARGLDIVLIDTAGRSHANSNLMEELEKVVRVSKPDMKIFVGDSLTGNDAVDQAKSFNEKIGIDGIILSKVDVDDKGGAAISVSYITKKPILFIGTGQTYNDFEEFDKNKIIQNLGF